MALKIVTGGTTGAADGTLVSSGNKLTITALSPSYINAHIRCDDGYWSNDQAFTIPSNIQISFDGGSTWKGSADSPYTGPEIEDVNFPIRIRQVASASGDVSLVTDGTYTAITALSDVSGLSGTAGDASVALSWSAVTNRTYYEVQRATDSGFTTGLTTLTSTLTGTSYTDTGLTNGTTYYYRVKALGTGRYSDSANWATTNATPTAVIFSDSFATLDTTTNWLAITSGSASIAASGGKAVITKNATGNKALLVAKANALAASANWTVTALVDMSGIGASDDQHPVLALARKSSAPTSGDTFTDDVYFPIRIELYRLSTDGHLYFRFKYLDTGGTANWFDFGTPAWSTSFDGATNGTGSWIKLLSDTGQYQYVIQGHATNGVRMIVKSADGATTYGTSAYVPWSSINGSGSYYIAFGAWQYSFTTAFTGTMNVDSVIVT